MQLLAAAAQLRHFPTKNARLHKLDVNTCESQNRFNEGSRSRRETLPGSMILTEGIWRGGVGTPRLARFKEIRFVIPVMFWCEPFFFFVDQSHHMLMLRNEDLCCCFVAVLKVRNKVPRHLGSTGIQYHILYIPAQYQFKG